MASWSCRAIIPCLRKHCGRSCRLASVEGSRTRGLVAAVRVRGACPSRVRRQPSARAAAPINSGKRAALVSWSGSDPSDGRAVRARLHDMFGAAGRKRETQRTRWRPSCGLSASCLQTVILPTSGSTVSGPVSLLPTPVTSAARSARRGLVRASPKHRAAISALILFICWPAFSN